MAAASGERAVASAFAACVLDAHPRSIAEARRTVRTTLREWDLAELSDSVECVVSELVTNAVRHGVPGAAPLPVPEPQPVTLTLVRRGGEVVCAVFDPGAGVPAPCEAEDVAESGRGLQIVATLSDAWGWSAPGPVGKAVWSRFTAPAGTGGPADVDADGDGDRDSEWQSFARCLALLESLVPGRLAVPAPAVA